MLCRVPAKPKETAAYTGADLQGKQEGNGGREGGVGLNEEALSGRMKDGEGVFFGKGANPITSSGADLVSLAAQNSHFDGLFLPPLVPSCFFF